MIPPSVAAGYCVIAPDTFGFGRSDKPDNQLDYTFAARVKWMHDFVLRLPLTKINLVCQDWGGPNTERVVAADPDRSSRVVFSNAGPADGRFISLAMAPKLPQLLAQTPVLNTEDCDNATREGLGERGGFHDPARNAAAGRDMLPLFLY